VPEVSLSDSKNQWELNRRDGGKNSLMMYLNFYSLQEIPFAPAPEVKFFYRSKEHTRALRKLLSAVTQGEIACLTGEIGSGKTILIEALLQNLSADYFPMVIRDPRFPAREFLESIARELEVEGILPGEHKFSSQELKDKILIKLKELSEKQRKLVIILDEAQLLSDPHTLEELRLLTNLDQGRNLSLLLVGQPELERRLQEPFFAPLRQRIRIFHSLGRLSSSETAAYVKHRLQIAGCSRSPFTSSALRTIYRFSKGIPRLINHLATTALEEGYFRQKSHINKSLVKEVGANLIGKKAIPWVRWVTAVALLLIVTGFWLVRGKEFISIPGISFSGIKDIFSRPKTFPTPTAIPVNASLGGEIVYTSDRTGNWEIYRLDMQNLSTQQLTFTQAWNGVPGLSSDGKKILFASNREGNHEIYLMNLDGSNLENLTSSSSWEGEPAWSPEGKEIAFTSDREGNHQIYLLNLESRTLRPLTHGLGENWSPAWSPDGKYLAYCSNREGNYQIYQWNFGEEKESRLIANEFNNWSPYWSPSGERLAFVSDRDGNPEIYCFSVNSDETIRLTNDPGSDLSPCWGPDGKNLLFASDRTGNYEIYLLNDEGSEIRRISNSGKGNSWSPRWR